MNALLEAAGLVADVRVQRMLAGDADTADRLAELHRHLADEHEYLDGVERHGLPTTDRRYPPGATVGWLMAYDPHVRSMRALRGISNPREGLL